MHNLTAEIAGWRARRYAPERPSARKETNTNSIKKVGTEIATDSISDRHIGNEEIFSLPFSFNLYFSANLYYSSSTYPPINRNTLGESKMSKPDSEKVAPTLNWLNLVCDLLFRHTYLRAGEPTEEDPPPACIGCSLRWTHRCKGPEFCNWAQQDIE